MNEVVYIFYFVFIFMESGKVEKITLIFCDITGTIFSKKQNTTEDYLNFKQIINDISIETNSKILFSLASSDDSNFVIETLEKLSSFIPKIKENIHFFGSGYILNKKIVYNNINSKAYQIVTYINQLKKTYDIHEIIIIDDCEFNHEMIKLLIDEEFLNNKITSLIPIRMIGLLEVNELLKEKTDKLKIYVKK